MVKTCIRLADSEPPAVAGGHISQSEKAKVKTEASHFECFPFYFYLFTFALAKGPPATGGGSDSGGFYGGRTNKIQFLYVIVPHRQNFIGRVKR